VLNFDKKVIFKCLNINPKAKHEKKMANETMSDPLVVVVKCHFQVFVYHHVAEIIHLSNLPLQN